MLHLVIVVLVLRLVLAAVVGKVIIVIDLHFVTDLKHPNIRMMMSMIVQPTITATRARHDMHVAPAVLRVTTTNAVIVMVRILMVRMVIVIVDAN